MTVSKHWCNLEIDTNKHKDINFAFANHGEEDEIYQKHNARTKNQRPITKRML
jgi:hypothetical protein